VHSRTQRPDSDKGEVTVQRLNAKAKDDNQHAAGKACRSLVGVGAGGVPSRFQYQGHP